MYRLNCSITEEAEEILKREAKRIGTSMGTIITMWALSHNKEDRVLEMSSFINQLKDKLPPDQLPNG